MTDAQRFDRWFKSLPFAKQAELRRNGVIPYGEMPVDDNVFPVVENHKSWTYEPTEEREETTAYLSEDTVRERLSAILCVLEKFSDRNMKLHLRFIRSLLGSSECEPLAKLSKEFGITKQAMTWRARQVRAALGRLSPATTRKDSVDTQGKESPKGGVIKRVAARPGVFLRVSPQKPSYLDGKARKPAKTRKSHGGRP